MILVFLIFIIYLSLVLGQILYSIAKEEYEPGKRYFNILKRLANWAFIFVVFYTLKPDYILLAIGLIIGAFIRLDYLYYGLILTYFTNSPETLILLSSILFFYGLIKGTLEHKNRHYLELLIFLPALIPSLNLNFMLQAPIVSLYLGLLISSSEFSRFLN